MGSTGPWMRSVRLIVPIDVGWQYTVERQILPFRPITMFMPTSKLGVTIFACDEYSVPAHLQEGINFIKPTIHFEDYAGVKRKRSNSLRRPTERSIATVRSSPTSVIEPDGIFSPNIQYNLSNCDQYTTPECLRVLYNFINGSLAL